MCSLKLHLSNWSVKEETMRKKNAGACLFFCWWPHCQSASATYSQKKVDFFLSRQFFFGRQPEKPSSSDSWLCSIFRGRSHSIQERKDNNLHGNMHHHTASQMKTQKRKDYLSWDDYFMAVVTSNQPLASPFWASLWNLIPNDKAFLSAQRSKDPHTQVGACIVNREKKIVGIGYNGSV